MSPGLHSRRPGLGALVTTAVLVADATDVVTISFRSSVVSEGFGAAVELWTVAGIVVVVESVEDVDSIEGMETVPEVDAETVEASRSKKSASAFQIVPVQDQSVSCAVNGDEASR